MPSLFVANCSKATHIFQFMPRGVNKMVSLTIKPGFQASIRDKTKEELDSILKPQLKYGYTEANQVLSDKEFSGICYSFDKPITRTGIEEFADHRNDVIDLRSQQIRQETTQAIDEKVTSEANRMGLNVNKTVLSIEEVRTPEHNGRNARSPVSQELVIDKSEQINSRGRGRPRKNK